MGELVHRKGPQGSPRVATEAYPSAYAPASFGARDSNRRRAAGRNVPGEDAEHGAGNCCMCGMFLMPEEADLCPHCESDNPQGRRLNRAG